MGGTVTVVRICFQHSKREWSVTHNPWNSHGLPFAFILRECSLLVVDPFFYRRNTELTFHLVLVDALAMLE